MKKINKHKIFIFIITLITLFLLFMFFKNIIYEMIKLQINNDLNGVKSLLKDKGWLGVTSIILVEAFQMVVVFISAEFIQVSAGMAYPWYIAILLCDLGVFLGATIIYLLVNTFKFDSSMFKKSTDKVQAYSKKGISTQLIMYFLFVMPVIPFGAICYYGSNTKISYRRYILTCVTGVIPSILSSLLMGYIISYSIVNKISIWLVILLVILVMVVLIITGVIIANKLIFKDNENTPDSPIYNFLLKIFKFLTRKNKVKYVNKEVVKNIEPPYLLLTNHPSFYDVYFATNLVYPTKLAFILNKYYYKNKIIKSILTKTGVITKKLFSPDLNTIKGTLKTIKKGYPIYMCPEGRLEVDGTNYYITKETGKFIKQLKIPVIIAVIKGTYISKPKWRKSHIKSNVEVEVTKIISVEELSNLSTDEINDLINEKLTYNEFDYIKEKQLTFNNKNKAKGLEGVLYYCPNCHKEYTLSSDNNTIKCENCGFSLTIQEDYHFSDNEFKIKTIHDWYNIIKEYERNNIKKGINLSCYANVKKFNIDNKTLNEEGHGKCTLTNKYFKFEGDLNVKEFTIDIKNLRALAYSCNEEFECYYNDELYYFYPTINKQQCAKWALIVDEMVALEDNNE